MIHIGPVEVDAQPIDPEKRTAFHGHIKEVFYQGDFSEITVVIKEAAMPLSIHLTRGTGPETQLSEGQEVIVSWDCSSNNVLSE